MASMTTVFVLFYVANSYRHAWVGMNAKGCNNPAHPATSLFQVRRYLSNPF